MTIKTRKTDKSKKTIDQDSVESNGSVVNPQVSIEGLERPVTGRSVFAVRTLGNAVSVESVFIEEGGNVLRLPAVFPNHQYAMEQIDELRKIVIQHFEQMNEINSSEKN